MVKTKVLRARVTEKHWQKVTHIGERGNMSPSEVLRLLVESADVEHINAPRKENSRSAQVLAGQSATAVIG